MPDAVGAKAPTMLNKIRRKIADERPGGRVPKVILGSKLHQSPVSTLAGLSHKPTTSSMLQPAKSATTTPHTASMQPSPTSHPGPVPGLHPTPLKGFGALSSIKAGSSCAVITNKEIVRDGMTQSGIQSLPTVTAKRKREDDPATDVDFFGKGAGGQPTGGIVRRNTVINRIPIAESKKDRLHPDTKKPEISLSSRPSTLHTNSSTKDTPASDHTEKSSNSSNAGGEERGGIMMSPNGYRKKAAPNLFLSKKKTKLS